MLLSINSTKKIINKIKFDFHVSKNARQKYDFDQSLFSIVGDLIITNSYQARLLSDKINTKRKEQGIHDVVVTAGMINALGLVHEIFHFLMRLYEEKENPGVFSKSINHLRSKIGEENLHKTLLQFIYDFPPIAVYNKNISEENYLKGSTDNKPNIEIIFEEIILLNLENINPATAALEELYSDKEFASKTSYINLIDETEKFFLTEKPFGSENLSLIHFLRKPIITSPYNIEGQLDYIREKWGVYVHEMFHDRLLKGKDLIYEDVKLFVQHGGGEKATPPVPEYKFDAEFFESLKRKLARGEELTEDEMRFYYSEPEQFTSDIDWMPKVMMIAKNIFVWLDQLSKKYQREIKRLDQIPDEELNQIAGWNFNALWLIGIWERSTASKKIKQYTGNPDAAPSAYSLYDYIIANELGGEEAFLNFKARALHRGIRVASDMVPNHTGIYSKWVVEKPDYFISTDQPPYPSYTFFGGNLSDDPRVEVRIEDKYYSKSDAAVVFQRRDTFTGDIKYIYHGNDGTNMPWNDTAQLNLLNPEARESLIQTIMHVARKTSIIRFDAAMTLTKKHYQRLWFPQAGSAGAVPSRSDSSMTRAQFDEAMPVEFWREVVDRINKEMPNTLLLAEAFWLMEGYFVRTLGMHRVYNSAFMHMLMKEENDKYKQLIKNTLEFNPEILKRYVNFMSNPDEETAVNQFGKGDKYFGIAMMMVTMPGLPMFAHGQIEGFSEKYGMEYKRAYYDEYVDDNLVRRHEAEIFPLIQKRYLFSQVNNFELYDFIDDYGNVVDSVFVYSNEVDGGKSVVIFNNSYTECRGSVNHSSGKIVNGSNLQSKKIAEALKVNSGSDYFYIAKESRTNLEYLISGKNLHEYGWYITLNGYEYKVYLNFKEIHDTSGKYWELLHTLGGRGVPSIEDAFKQQSLTPLHNSIKSILNNETADEFNRLYINRSSQKSKDVKKNLEEFVHDIISKYDSIKTQLGNSNYLNIEQNDIEEEITAGLNSVHKLSEIWDYESNKKRTLNWFEDIKEDSIDFNSIGKNINNDFVLSFLIIDNILSLTKNVNDRSKYFNDLMLNKVLIDFYDSRKYLRNISENKISLMITLCDKKIQDIFKNEFSLLRADSDGKISKTQKTKSKTDTNDFSFIEILFEENSSKSLLGVHSFEGTMYYNKENFEELLKWIFYFTNLFLVKESFYSKPPSAKTKKKSKKDVTLEGTKKDKDKTKSYLEDLKLSSESYKKIKDASLKSGYKVEELIKLLTLKNEKKKTSNKKVTKNSISKSKKR